MSLSPRSLTRAIVLAAILAFPSWIGLPGGAALAVDSGVRTLGTIIPLYSYPTLPTWDTLVEVKHRYPYVPVIAIVDPANGPGAAPDANYSARIPFLKTNGITVIGYVDTAYAQKPLADAESEIATWKQFYPDVDGIFLDQMSNLPGNESYYSGLDGYAASLGLLQTVANPGTDTLESYVGTVDVMLIYENSGLPDLSSFATDWHAGYDKRNFGVIPYAMPRVDRRFIRSAAPLVGWIYMTDDVLPNPWDTLPPYFRRLMSAINRAGRVRR